MNEEYVSTSYYCIGGIHIAINWEDSFSFDSYTGEFLEWQFFPILQAYEIRDKEVEEVTRWDIIVNMSVAGLAPKKSKQIVISNQYYDAESEQFAYDIWDEKTGKHINYRVEVQKQESFIVDIFRNADNSPFRRLRHLGTAFQQLAPYFNGFVMHGSGIEVRGQGVVFTGFSGMGKTTQARLWRRYRDISIINGDSPLILQAADGVKLCGTPWCGSSGESINRSIPMKAIVIIERSKKNYVEEITGDDAVLAVYTSILYFSKNRKEFERMFSVYEKIVRQLKVYRLHCNMEEDAVDTLDEALQKDGI